MPTEENLGNLCKAVLPPYTTIGLADEPLYNPKAHWL